MISENRLGRFDRYSWKVFIECMKYVKRVEGMSEILVKIINQVLLLGCTLEV